MVTPDREGQRTRVLIADDNDEAVSLLRMALAHYGLEVVGAVADGRQAIEQARSLRPDVVLMDVTMPVMNGIEATRQIAGELPEVRVVGLSAYGADTEGERMVMAGADGYVVKGGPVEEIVTEIRNALRRRSSSEADG
jgi:DNA-binding NarL/FixJ family response regulator